MDANDIFVQSPVCTTLIITEGSRTYPRDQDCSASVILWNISGQWVGWHLLFLKSTARIVKSLSGIKILEGKHEDKMKTLLRA